jgi:glutaredoxin
MTSSDAGATGGPQDRPTAGDVTALDFYWRPGCGFCLLLERRLTKLGLPMRMHNIWLDDAAAAFVRTAARGHETVPTVAVGTTALVNPSAPRVVAVLADEAPHLLPHDSVTSGPGRLARFLGRAGT